jgi:hypothetical protein
MLRVPRESFITAEFGWDDSNEATMNLSDLEPLSVMLSSRCSDKVMFEGKPQEISVLRRAIKAQLESIEIGEISFFKVWIHEDDPFQAGDADSWEKCLDKVRKADLVIVLYNGACGSAMDQEQSGARIGICHAEMHEALTYAPSKVRAIMLPEIETKKKSPDANFQEYFKRQNILGARVKTGDEAMMAVQATALAALLSLARQGVGESAKGKFYGGDALSWSRLDFNERRRLAIRTVTKFLQERGGRAIPKLDRTIALNIQGEPVAFVCDCIPASMGVAAARELVGQPFLLDHRTATALPKGIAGPVHLITCQKSISESQALRQLGFPDAVLVTAPFGVYVADDVQKIQMVFMANCRDETTTCRRVQRFLEWLSQEQEDRLLARRAVSRRRISDLIAQENATPAGSK